MIIAPDWLFIRPQKTGGTFAENALKVVLAKQGAGIFHRLFHLPGQHRFRFLYTNRIYRYLFAKSLARSGALMFHDHMPYSEVPAAHRDKWAIVLCRSPFDQLASRFYYYADQVFPQLDKEKQARARSFLPNFPDHSFESWVRYCEGPRLDDRLQEFGMSRDELGMEMGFVFFTWINFLLKDPAAGIRAMDRDYFASGRYRGDICDFVPVHTENLNEELYRVLIESGTEFKHARFLLSTKTKINVSERRENRDWREYYNDDLVDYVLKKEWAWFELFPEHLEQLKENFPGYFARNTVKTGAGN